jgi:hypothetical protein
LKVLPVFFGKPDAEIVAIEVGPVADQVNGGCERAVVLFAQRKAGVGAQRFTVEFHGDGDKIRFLVIKQFFKIAALF